MISKSGMIQKLRHSSRSHLRGRAGCAFLLTLLLLLSACGAKKPAELSFLAMDTYVELKAYGENGDEFLSLANEETLRLETLCSAHSEKSALYRLNSGENVRDPELEELIARALDISRETGGAFDPTLLPLSRLWGFGGGSVTLPEDGEISLALESAGYEKVSFSASGAVELNGTQLDLGGIAKGLAADSFADLARETGVESAFGSFGGTVCAVGTKPGGDKWKVALRDPLSDGFAAVIEVDSACVSTSGAYERYFTYQGKLYHHILDPKSGRPAESDLLSVTVADPSGTRADALSTALFVMGEDRALEFCRDNGVRAILITRDKRMVFVGGIEPVKDSVGEAYAAVFVK